MKGHLCLSRVFTLITKIYSESFDFALSLLLTHVVCMKPTLSCLIISGLRKTLMLTLLLALVALVFTPNNVRTISVFIVILH